MIDWMMRKVSAFARELPFTLQVIFCSCSAAAC